MSWIDETPLLEDTLPMKHDPVRTGWPLGETPEKEPDMEPDDDDEDDEDEQDDRA